MSENPPPDQNRPPALMPLDYEAPLPDWARRRRNQWSRIVAGVLMAGSVFAIVFLFVISNIEATTTQFAPAGIAAAMVAFVLGGIAWWQWKRHHSTAFAAGLLIGLGVAALMEGLCFALLTTR